MATLRIRNIDGKVQVGKLICLLGNYSKHVKEMKGTTPEQIMFFLKPSTSVIHDGGSVILPKASKEVHHEVELAVVIGKKGKNIPQSRVDEHILGYCVLLDITARDIQDKCKKEGRPWAIPKGFDTFAPMSDIAPRDEVGDTSDLRITLDLNGVRKQDSSTKFMAHKVDEVVAYCSTIMTLEAGDVIATGTPEGVGQLRPGDKVIAEIAKVGRVGVSVIAEE
jgi:2-keto-4-pentenoate hydratase/2-oxohepta-3-ene-1,7-dioic acid hydratase in catechol pathway